MAVKERTKPGEYMVKLRRSGGSESIVLPKAMREQFGIVGAAKLRAAKTGILVEPVSAEPATIEDEPEFAIFLDFLAKDALSHPEALVDAEVYRDRGRTLVDAALVE
jgi:hypothetical protein